MSERSKNWPLVEVIVEFRLPDGGWRDDLPDRMHARLKDVFPVRKVVKRFTQEWTFSPSQHDQSYKQFDRHQFLTVEGRQVVQVDPTVVSVNCLAPYTGWEVFFPVISAVADAYAAEIEAQPAATALQFINRLELHGERIDIDDYFEFRPRFDGSFIQCSCGVMQPWPEGKGVIVRHLQTQTASGAVLPVMLVLSARRTDLSPSMSLDWLQSAHQKLNQIFKNSVTDAARALFDKEDTECPR